jgi:CheY-like chemotaxis protein
MSRPTAVAAPHILLVDDDQAIRSAMGIVLADEGYRVSLATNGADALALLGREWPDLIVLDLNMPVMTGWEFYQHLQAQERTVPVVFMTAGQRAHEEARRHGAADALAKPFDISELVAVVQRHLPPPP